MDGDRIQGFDERSEVHGRFRRRYKSRIQKVPPIVQPGGELA